MNIALPSTESVAADFDKINAILRIRFGGDLTSTTIAALHRDVQIILGDEHTRAMSIKRVELDMNSAKMVDSLGLNLVITLLKWAKNRDACLGIQISKRGVYSTLLAVGLERQANLVLTSTT